MRATFAILDDIVYRSKAAAALLNISESALRNYEKASGEVLRANAVNPSAPAVRLFKPQDIFRIAGYRRSNALIKTFTGGPVVVSVAINKGGVGKSTTAAEIAVGLSLEGYKTLLIDLDVQANVSQLLGYESDFTLDEAEENGLLPEAIIEHTFKDVMENYVGLRNARSKEMADVTHALKRPFGADGPTVIGSDGLTDELDMILAFDRGNRDLVFHDFLNDSKAGKIPGLDVTEYDFVVFDCPPSMNFSTTNAIAASHFVVAPIKLDSFGVKGLARLMQTMAGLNKRAPNVRPELMILPTHYEKNVARIPRMQQQLQIYKDFLVPVAISRTESFPKTQENYLPLTLQMPTSVSAKEYRQVTEILIGKALKQMTKSA